MCILFIYRNPNADIKSYRLIVATNRDEIYKRPALSAHYWKKHPECLGGIDMEPGKEGGTWLAVSMRGRAAVILNLYNENNVISPSKKSRGPLISNFVTSNDSIETYLNQLHKENIDGQPYNPYCLVSLDLKNANTYYLSSDAKSAGPKMCDSDIIGVGNSGMDNSYKKVEVGKKEFKQIVQNANISKQNILIEELINFLKSQTKCLPDATLQKNYPTTYEEHSSIFVSGDEYGTRTHSVLLIDGSNQVTFVEETLTSDLTWKRQQFQNELIYNNIS